MKQTGEQIIIQTQHKIWQAILAKDFHALDALYSKDYSIRHVGGGSQTKEEWYAALKNGTFEYFTYEPVKESVSIRSERAILHSHAQTHAHIYGMTKTWNMKFDIPYIKEDGIWKPAAHNAFPIWHCEYPPSR